MTPKWLPGHGALIPAHAVPSAHGHRHTQAPWLSGPGPGLCAHSICTAKDWRPQEAMGILGKISCPLVFNELWWEAGRTLTMSSSPDGPEMPPCWHRQACAWYLAHAHKGPELPKPPGSSEEASGGSTALGHSGHFYCKGRASTKPPPRGPNSRPLLTSFPLHVTT